MFFYELSDTIKRETGDHDATDKTKHWELFQHSMMPALANRAGVVMSCARDDMVLRQMRTCSGRCFPEFGPCLIASHSAAR